MLQFSLLAILFLSNGEPSSQHCSWSNTRKTHELVHFDFAKCSSEVVNALPAGWVGGKYHLWNSTWNNMFQHVPAIQRSLMSKIANSVLIFISVCRWNILPHWNFKLMFSWEGQRGWSNTAFDKWRVSRWRKKAMALRNDSRDSSWY